MYKKLHRISSIKQNREEFMLFLMILGQAKEGIILLEIK